MRLPNGELSKRGDGKKLLKSSQVRESESQPSHHIRVEPWSDSDISSELYALLFDEGKFQRRRGFNSMRAIDISVANLPTRLRDAKFGLINNPTLWSSR
jgi:hypothetical protein